MDVAALSTDLSLSAAAGQVDLGVLKAVQNLDQNVGAQLAASIGLGRNVDAYA
jgi:hypothetical protein